MNLKPYIRLALAVALCLSSALASAWPDRPITLVVPYTPGSGIDQVARQLSAFLPGVLGQPVIVENVPGASGNIGSERVARAKPDGYTLLVQVNTLVMNKSLYKSLAYDPVNGFAPVSQTSWGTLVLVVNSELHSWKSVADLVAAAKRSRASLTYATPGLGTPHHLAMVMFSQRTDAELLHVPYKGAAGAVTDLLGGRIDAMFLPVHVALQHIRAGKLRALAISSPQRASQLPDVPTLKEAGITAESVDMWYGVLAPKGTPGDLITQLNAAIGQVMARPEVKQAFDAQGMVPATSTPGAFEAMVRKDADRWAEVVRRGQITAD